MIVSLGSDLHFRGGETEKDFQKILVPPTMPSEETTVLILLGDIANPFSTVFSSFLTWCIRHWHHVLFVAGNHELYSASKTISKRVCWVKQVEQIQKVCKETGVCFLEKSSVTIEDVTFLGTTLWSHIPIESPESVDPIYKYINDYFFILQEDFQPISIETTNQWHHESIEWLTNELDKEEKKVIVLTHHAPLMKGTSSPCFEQQKGRILNHVFASDLSELLDRFSDKIQHWCFGHTHFNCNKDPNALLLSNQRGYTGEFGSNSTYNPSFHFLV